MGENTKMAVGNKIMLIKVTILFLKEFYDDTFWRKNLEPTNEKSSKFRWSNCQNPEIKNRKIAKIDNILNLDLEVVAHSKTVQNTSKTPKLPICKRQNSS